MYPKYVTSEVHRSVKKDKSLSNYLDRNSNFIMNLELAKVTKLEFRNSENEVCNTVEIDKLESNELGYFSQKSFFECQKLCLSLKPTVLLRSNFCIHLDNQMKITKIEEPIYWINYR